MHLAAPPFPQPIRVLRPSRQSAPVVFSSAHSGIVYPDEFLAASRLDAHRLRRSEDSFVDTLFSGAPAYGAPLICANFPRAWCDANREPWELDPAMFEDTLPDWVNVTSPRVAAGLGTVAKLVASGETIYRRRLRFAEAEARVAECWQPFHEGLAGLLDSTHRQFGVVVLIDCHSMPGNALPAKSGADFVLGDAHGTACNPIITAGVEQILRGMGYRVLRNDPYAGGFITRHYGRPTRAVHALQIEINRALYMDEEAIAPSAGFAGLASQMTELVAGLVALAGTLIAPGALAAE